VAQRFLIDENLSPMPASRRSREHGFDAVHVNALRPDGTSDREILSYATVEDRVVVTNNADDFRTLRERFGANPGLAVLLDAAGRQR
jgi:predicted nuclease of predicted toxin-antitoxin system